MSIEDMLDDEIYINSLRQLDKNLSAALAGVSASTILKQQHGSFNNATNRYSSLVAAASHQFGVSPSFNQSLNQLSHMGGGGDNILLEARAFPYERLSQNIDSSIYHPQAPTQHHLHLHHQQQLGNLPTTSSQSNSSHSYGNTLNSASCKIYQDLDEFKGHLV